MNLAIFGIVFQSTLLCLILTPIGIYIARRIGYFDLPNSAPHKLHKQKVPHPGGTILFVVFVIVVFLNGLLSSPITIGLLLSSAIILVFGIWDDLKGLNAPIKLAGQLLAIVILIQFEIQVTLFEQTSLNFLVTFLWIVGITNAFNFLDGGDGVATGLAAITAASLMMATLISGQLILASICAIILGASISLYLYNSSPALIYLGDSGSQILGFTLSVLALAYNPIGFSRNSSWIVPILLFGIPIFDVSMVVFSRIRRGIPIYKGELNHTYHRLIQAKLEHSRAISVMFLVSILLSSLALSSLPWPPSSGIQMFIAVLFLGAVAVYLLDIKVSS